MDSSSVGTMHTGSRALSVSLILLGLTACSGFSLVPRSCPPCHFPGTSSSLWSSDNNNYGEDMDQQAMMESDMLVTVDENDLLVSTEISASKKLAHTFTTDQPRGILHRAFSFFLFDQDNKMLLTQRALSKITFPGVWTNTCCSHPLYGMTPNEVDVTPDAYPDFPGIKHAAIRKLKHELGIEAQYVPHDKITFLSRFHYWASDTVTYGTENPPWGEHEVDYIYFSNSPRGR
ncbi:Isopentenyl-diphosphate Delta-isomerase 1 [Seminavis robusta]|uniref:isopentenyl-diphosphate Delta-isomerase n=1 Tax=Seminavis robusta TaxID=568900 RepID=A0A9N8EZR5_9STRA|nr:Isopentenyl-diphosphate Delta-isomerase 1 [Seminavis robusta]|eukprot:Sro3214_g345430.1 Isopentenyl-diphosphate Delta-isomerase 1 (232) ;mRNA; r:6126-6973